MEYKNGRLMLSYAEAYKLHRSTLALRVNLKSHGLQSINVNRSWIHSGKQESYLEVIDEKMYLLSKLKYGV